MSSVSTTSPTPPVAISATSLLALTTPFVQRPQCASIWEITSADTGIPGADPLPFTLLASNAADPRFASCQPSGWAEAHSASRFTFSPAVCPSGWTYYDLNENVDYTKAETWSTYSTAYCCASGYSLRGDLTAFPLASFSAPCLRSVGPDQDVSLVGTLEHGAGETAVFTQGYQVHEAWHISWHSSDTSTMSPSLPDVGSSGLLPKWVPGQKVPDTGNNDNRGDGPKLGGVIWFVMIGVPIIGVAIIALGVWCWIRHRRKKRRQIQAPITEPHPDST